MLLTIAVHIVVYLLILLNSHYLPYGSLFHEMLSLFLTMSLENNKLEKNISSATIE